MDKCVTYKNFNEYIKITFPNVYQNKKYSSEISLESIIEKNSNDFKIKMSNIIKNNEKQKNI